MNWQRILVISGTNDRSNNKIDMLKLANRLMFIIKPKISKSHNNFPRVINFSKKIENVYVEKYI